MTLSSTTSRVVYPGAGSVGPFSVPFRILAAADLLVVLRDSDDIETTLAYLTDYTVAGVLSATCSITLTTALAVGETLSIRRAPSMVQPTSLENNGSYFGKTHENEFDRIVMQLQSLQDQVDRAFGVLESIDPSGLSLRLKPETGKAVVWQSQTELGNALIDTGGVAVPGAGRTVSSVSAYLLNNAIFNVKDYGAAGDGSTNDTTAVKAAIAAANAVVGPNAGYKTQIGGIVYFPRGTYLLTDTLAPFPGVAMVGEGIWSTVLMFSMADTKHGIVYDSTTTGFTPYLFNGHGWGGAIRDMKITTTNYASSSLSCDTMVRVLGVVDFEMTNVTLIESRGRLLHIENVLSVTLTHVSLQKCKGDAGLWIGSAGSVTTTVRAFGLYASSCEGGPNVDVAGLSLDFFGLITESAGTDGVGSGLAGAYGIRIRSGKAALYSPYFEDNADHDVYVGSDTDEAPTTVLIDNAAILVDTNKIANKGGVYLDNVSYACLRGGDYSAVSRPLQMTANCGFVDAQYYAPGKPPLLTSGADWRTKADLNYTTGARDRVQSLDKTPIAAAGTAILTIPTQTAAPAFLRVHAEVTFNTSANVRTIALLEIVKEGDSFADGGAVITLIADESAGNFLVQIANFVVTFGANSVIVTYTCANGGGTTNQIRFFVDGVGIGGDVSLA